LFVNENIAEKRAIPSMTGVFSWSVDEVAGEALSAQALGISAVLLFGIPARKDEQGSEAWSGDGVVQRAIRRIKAEADVLVIADLCLCEYTSHGHCGVLHDGKIDNDDTLELYARTAVSQARAGADIIAPSGMMDGMVQAIRKGLDSEGFRDIPIMSYAAKYASAFYGPFREAACSAPQWGDRRSHQMDPPNRREAIKEMRLDVEEGADILMVKPALSYLDVIREARNEFELPIAAYTVSGEYAMVEAAAEKGWIDRDRMIMEILTSIKRAGADIIISYHAKDAARILEAAG
jgi:porphobilinogen synthase